MNVPVILCQLGFGFVSQKVNCLRVITPDANSCCIFVLLLGTQKKTPHVLLHLARGHYTFLHVKDLAWTTNQTHFKVTLHTAEQTLLGHLT